MDLGDLIGVALIIYSVNRKVAFSFLYCHVELCEFFYSNNKLLLPFETCGNRATVTTTFYSLDKYSLFNVTSTSQKVNYFSKSFSGRHTKLVYGKIMFHGKMYHHKDRIFFQKIKNVSLFDSLLCNRCKTSVFVTDMVVLKLFCLDRHP